MKHDGRDQNMKQSGQGLSEMLILLPVFLTLLSGAIALASALDWRGALSEASLSLQLGRTAGGENTETDPLRLGTSKRERLSVYSLPHSPRSPATTDEAGRLSWDDDRVSLQGRALSWQSRHSDAVEGLVARGPELSRTTAPVYDAAADFRSDQRESWDLWAVRQSLRSPAYLNFKSGLASGGSIRDSGPYNLSRDCLFSDQGYVCPESWTRKPGPTADLLWQQRRRASALQIAACTLELCARTVPAIFLCPIGGALTGAQSLAVETPKPGQCPITGSTIEALHTGSNTILSAWAVAIRFQESCTDPEKHAKLLESPVGQASRYAQCALSLFDPEPKLAFNWESMVDSFRGLY